jgi:uncharacterized protein YndB with AHSA1/START domain
MKNMSEVGSSQRILHKEVVVPTPIGRVWRAWTTSEGLASWWVKDSWIELRIGGPWEVYFLKNERRGGQGSEGCRILSYRPPEMLSFSWNFPPTLPELRAEYLWVVLRFVPLGPTETQVILDHLGWKQGPVWEQGYQYFDDAWGSVLELLRTQLPIAEARDQH